VGANSVAANITADTGQTIAFVNPGNSAVAIQLAVSANTVFTIDGAGTVNISGDVADATGDAVFAVTDGTVNFTDAIDNAVLVDAQITVAGATLNVGTVTVTTDGDADSTIAAGATLAVTLGTTNGSIASEDGDTDLVMADLAIITPTIVGSITNGAAITIVNNTTTVANAVDGTDDPIVTDNNARFDFTLDDNGPDLTLTVTKTSNASLGLSAAASAINDAVDVALAGDVAAAEAMNGITTAAALNTALETLAPEPAAPANTVAASTGSTVFGVGASRLASLRTGTAYASAAATGFSTGNPGSGVSVWIRPFTSFADQDTRDGIAGFDAETYGLAGGWDANLDEDGYVTGGFALSYANSDIDGQDAGNSQTDIESYQVTLYGDYTTSGGYIEGLVGYARNSVDTSRQIAIGALNRTATGDYEADQYMASIDAGIPVMVGSNSFLTPHVGFQYTHMSSDSFTETGAGDLNLTVIPEDLDIALGIVGARYHFNMPSENGTLTPELRGSVMLDFASDEAQSSSTFAGGGAAFTTAGADVAELAWSFGAGLSYSTDDGGMTFGADYDAEIKDDFLGHSGKVEFKLHF